MITLTQRDKRTIRFAVIGIGVYLLLFYGLSAWNRLEAIRTNYQQLVREVQTAGLDLQRHQNKILLLEKLKRGSTMDLSKLPRASVVGQASEAIQKAAQASGIKLGPVRESPGSATGKELASMQLEASGPVTGVMTLLHRLDTLGFPLVVESLQIDPDSRKPGTVKLIIQVVLLDYERWKKEEGRNA